MNEDRIVGTGRNIIGKAESLVGDAIDDQGLEGRGALDQVSGAIQHGYGKAKDIADDLIDGAPKAITQAVERGKHLARRSEAAVQDRMGDKGALYLLAGAVALIAVGFFVAGRSRQTAAPKRALRNPRGGKSL
ncbi:MAG: CsbD family protein [Burkholderiales bacterium]|nr:MAG: CsbD family protein [Burkholderiales bacterium]